MVKLGIDSHEGEAMGKKYGAMTVADIRECARQAEAALLETGDPHDGDDWAMMQVVRAWMDDNPADDAEPVTEEWLRSLNAVQIDSLAQHWIVARIGNRFEVYYYPKCGTLRLHANNPDCDGSTSYGGTHVVTATPTRGHVRRLVAALLPVAA